MESTHEIPRRGPIVLRVAIDPARLAGAAVIPIATVSRRRRRFRRSDHMTSVVRAIGHENNPGIQAGRNP